MIFITYCVRTNTGNDVHMISCSSPSSNQVLEEDREGVYGPIDIYREVRCTQLLRSSVRILWQFAHTTSHLDISSAIIFHGRQEPTIELTSSTFSSSGK